MHVDRDTAGICTAILKKQRILGDFDMIVAILFADHGLRVHALSLESVSKYFVLVTVQ